MADNKLPKGKGTGNRQALSEAESKMYGIIGQQARQVNELNKTLIKNNEELTQSIDKSNTIQEALAKDLVKNTSALIQLFTPISNHFIEIGEEQKKITNRAKPTVFAKTSKQKQKPDAEDVPGVFSGLLKGVGGLFAGVGAGVLGGGLAALGGGLVAVAGGLKLFANPMTIAGATAFSAFLASLAGVAYLSGKAFQSIGEGFTDISKGLEDLSNVDAPDHEKLEELFTSIRIMTNSLSFNDSVKMRIMDGTVFSELSKGLEDISNVDIDVEGFKKVGMALEQFYEQTSFSTTIKNIFSSDNIFGDISGLSNGIQQLNNIQLDEGKLKRIGKDLSEFLVSVNNEGRPDLVKRGYKILKEFSGDTFQSLAMGLEALSNLKIEQGNLSYLGMELSTLLSNIGDKDAGTLEQLADVSRNQGFIQLANGLLELDKTGTKISKENIMVIGTSMAELFTSIDDSLSLFYGGHVKDTLITLSEVLKPFSQGINEIIKTSENISDNNFNNITNALQQLFDKDNFDWEAIRSVERIDDNLIRFSQGMDHLNNTAYSINTENFKKLKYAIKDLMDGLEYENQQMGLVEKIIGTGHPLEKFEKLTDKLADTVSSKFNEKQFVKGVDNLERLTNAIMKLKNTIRIVDIDNTTSVASAEILKNQRDKIKEQENATNNIVTDASDNSVTNNIVNHNPIVSRPFVMPIRSEQKVYS